MSILTASMTYGEVKNPSLSYGILEPKQGYHLEAIVRVTEFDRIFTRSFYFPEGTFTPSHIQWEIENEEAMYNDEVAQATFTLVDHKYHPVSVTIPELKVNQVYKVTFITGSLNNQGQSYDFYKTFEYVESTNDEEPLDFYVSCVYPNGKILKVEAVNRGEMLTSYTSKGNF